MMKFWLFLLTLSVIYNESIQSYDRNVKVYLYTKTKSKAFMLKDMKKILEDDCFDKRKPTVMFIHGWTDGNEGTARRIIIPPFQKRGDHNILFLDWGLFSKTYYFTSAIPRLYAICLKVAERLKEFFDEGYKVKKFYLFGHSLGGQASGLIARTLKEYGLKYELERITGLDPAGPGFYPEYFKKFKHISASDAKFVDVLHTDGGIMGAKHSTGTADFFPNGGSSMPGCDIRYLGFIKNIASETCNHYRSVEYFAESVINPYAFKAIEADSYDSFKNGKVNRSKKTYMGFACSKKSYGSYYLQTNAHSPYGKGSDGIKYENTNLFDENEVDDSDNLEIWAQDENDERNLLKKSPNKNRKKLLKKSSISKHHKKQEKGGKLKKVLKKLLLKH